MPKLNQLDIFSALHAERERQEDLCAEGRFAHTCASSEMSHAERLAVLGEEYGEVCRAVLEAGRLANDIHGGELRKELLHVAAVAVAWLEGMEV